MKKEKLKRAFVKLSWKLLEHKFKYYEGAKYGIKPVPDTEYDYLESVYNKLAKKLGVEPSTSKMVGFDINRPSCKLVANFLINTKGKSNNKIKIKGVVYQ